MKDSFALKKIKQLDPENDHWEISRLSTMYDFPWDYNRALELALFKTFASPSISKILHSSRQFEKFPQKRYDDTDLILSEILENGIDSGRGKATIERLNFIHSHFNISNEDYLFVLSTFVFEPKRWIDKYGWRKLHEKELIAGYKIWQDIGKAMHIENIPEKSETLFEFYEDYQKRNFVFAPENKKVGDATIQLLLGWYLPTPLFSLAKPFVFSIMDENLIRAMGYKNPPAWIRFLVNSFFKMRIVVLRMLLKRTQPFLRTQLKNKTYPKGYNIEKLGPNGM